MPANSKMFMFLFGHDIINQSQTNDSNLLFAKFFEDSVGVELASISHFLDMGARGGALRTG